MTGPAGLAALVLAAGEGSRLRPLTALRPKPLCPVGDSTLLDQALARVAGVVAVSPDRVAVNAHHLAEQVIAAVGGRAHLSVEQPRALGTAGAVGGLGRWLAGRPLLVVNGDAWLDGDPAGALPPLLSGWEGLRPRLLVVADAERPDFEGRWRFAGASLLPAATAAALPTRPLGLWEAVWREASQRGALDLVATDRAFVDCGTPADYLRANLLCSGGRSVVGAGARVEGVVERCVVWPGAAVAAGEHLVECVRATAADGSPLTVPAGPQAGGGRTRPR